MLLSAQKVLKFYTLHSVCVLARESWTGNVSEVAGHIFGAKKILKKINVFPEIFDLTESQPACPAVLFPQCPAMFRCVLRPSSAAESAKWSHGQKIKQNEAENGDGDVLWRQRVLTVLTRASEVN